MGLNPVGLSPRLFGLFAYRKDTHFAETDRSGERCAACWLLGSTQPRPAHIRSGNRTSGNPTVIVQLCTQPRLCDCLMVTQVTLQTESPPTGCFQTQGLRRLIRHMWRRSRYRGAWPGLVIRADAHRLRCGYYVRLSLEGSELCANAATRGRVQWACH